MAQLPSIPKGTRDYSPEIMVKRNYIFDTIKSVFKLYGYMPLETPAMENLSTLMGKYGEEGDKLLFKILNSGDFIGNIPDQELVEKNSIKLTNKISEKGLRYDLTVPFARFVVQHQSELTFPFKRYQIQPVWRADRPQKGRYREFYQCDVDVVGSDSLLHEVELIQMVDEVYRRLKIKVRLLINNRKILAGIAEIIGYPDQLTDITVAIDKMDKIGLDKVNAELREKGITEEAIVKLQPILNLEGSNSEKLEKLKTILQDSPIGLKGVEELSMVFDYLKDVDIRKFGSQGQQRTAALSLKLSEIELVKRITKDTPVLLLDDVLSELDSNRQNYLLNSIGDIQTIITCTGLEEFVNNRFEINRVFKVSAGTVTCVNENMGLKSEPEETPADEYNFGSL